MDIYLQNLNEAQRTAVRTTEGPVLVLAGAGSGKTRALTCRIAYLIREKEVKPWNILAITFTNKAAREMRSRVDALVENGADAVWISTFHAACARILRRHADSIGYTSSFTIYDTDDQKTLMKQVTKQLNLDPKDYREKAVLAEISTAKNALIGPEQYRKEHDDDYRGRKIAALYAEYQRQLLQNNAMDFDDLLCNTVELFTKDPYALEEYQDRFRYILVDEYQDTNAAQFRITSLLAAGHRNLCVVGDDDQSIYKFRGADIRNILDFEKEYPDAAVIRMEQNYRSTGSILEAANYVIANNRGRKGKKLWTENDRGEKVEFHRLDTEYEEAEWIIGRILRGKETVSYGNCAVLYRSNAQSRILEEKCIQFNVPYRLVGGVNFYQRKEIKDMICYLKTIQNGQDDVAVQRILNVPRRGIGQVTMERVAMYAAAHSISFFEALEQVKQIPGMERSGKKIKEFTDLIHDLRRFAETSSIQTLLEEILQKTKYEEELQKEGAVEAQTRMENIGELISKAAGFEEEDEEEDPLGRFLEEIALVADVDETEDDGERVTLMTLHASKGLEFRYVYISGMEDGLFPSRMTLQTGDSGDLEEERRLCYVGMTRARERLFLTAAGSRFLHGEKQYYPVSRFVKEIPSDLLQTDRGRAPGKGEYSAPGDRDYSIGSFSGRASGMTGYRAPGSGSRAGMASFTGQTGGFLLKTGKDFTRQDPGKLDYRAGDRVRHVKFGDGTVVKLEEGKSDTEVTVLFDKAGEKKLLAGFAKLLRI